MIKLVLDSNTDEVLGARPVVNMQPKLFKIWRFTIGKGSNATRHRYYIAYTQRLEREFHGYNLYKNLFIASALVDR